MVSLVLVLLRQLAELLGADLPFCVSSNDVGVDGAQLVLERDHSPAFFHRAAQRCVCGHRAHLQIGPDERRELLNARVGRVREEAPEVEAGALPEVGFGEEAFVERFSDGFGGQRVEG